MIDVTITRAMRGKKPRQIEVIHNGSDTKLVFELMEDGNVDFCFGEIEEHTCVPILSKLMTINEDALDELADAIKRLLNSPDDYVDPTAKTYVNHFGPMELGEIDLIVPQYPQRANDPSYVLTKKYWHGENTVYLPGTIAKPNPFFRDMYQLFQGSDLVVSRGYLGGKQVRREGSGFVMIEE